jgi:hypothetical protein
MAKTTGKRTKRSGSSEAVSNIADFAFNPDIGGNKVSKGILGVLIAKGAAPTSGAGMNFDNGAYVALYNSTGAAIAAQFTNSSGAPAPAGLADGPALKPNDYTILTVPVGQNYLKVSATGVFAYEMTDDTILSIREEFNG